MIKDTTIQQVRDRMDIADVLGNFLNLKRKGANLSCPCPFHSEKTASFTVSPTKQIYKCFGCGKTGDSITFLVEHERKTYPEAIQWLADRYNIQVELEQEDEDAKKQRQQKTDTITANVAGSCLCLRAIHKAAHEPARRCCPVDLPSQTWLHPPNSYRRRPRLCARSIPVHYANFNYQWLVQRSIATGFGRH
jgi:DNA primase